MNAKEEDYKAALDAACREWEQLAQQRAELDRRLVRLQDTIGALTRLCGYTPTVPWGLTDAIRIALHRAERPMTPVDVRDRLRTIGFDLTRYASELAAIHTVLKRLAKAGEARRTTRGGRAAYEWVKSGRAVAEQPHTHVSFGAFVPGALWTTKKS